MKIAVFGANGGIGKWGVKYALERGYDVTACVRRMPPQPLSTSNKLHVVVVNTDDNRKMEEILRDCNAVINCIGERQLTIQYWKRHPFFLLSTMGVVT